jgi:hypothetical protein
MGAMKILACLALASSAIAATSPLFAASPRRSR